MTFQGQLFKMSAELAAPVQYYLALSHDVLHVNQLIGRTVEIEHVGYQCVSCGSDQKIFRMGFCKKCFFESPYASGTIIRPELSTAHLGIEERDLEVEKEIQLVPHFVYLAYTGEVKVGVTRQHQVPTRWIDQGATFAMIIAKTENRYEAGMIEVALKEKFPDKTNRNKMLQHDYESYEDLQTFREQALQYFPAEYQQFYLEDHPVVSIDYPYVPAGKIQALTLDKNPQISGRLSGIKGQYLAFDDGRVINVRGHEGYVIKLTV